MLSGVFVERQKKIISNNSGILKQLKLTLGVKEGQFMLIRLVNSTEKKFKVDVFVSLTVLIA